MLFLSRYVLSEPYSRVLLDVSFIVILPSEKTLPARLNMELIKELQTTTAPAIFTPRAVYDGRKNLFAARELPFDGANYMEVCQLF